MISRAKRTAKILFSLTALLMVTGCMQSFHYEPTRDHTYSATPFVSATMGETNAIETADTNNFEPVRHALAISEPTPKTDILGNVHISNPLSSVQESMVFSVRKENRAYMAETPIGEAFYAGKHKITPNFALGMHKDHKAIAGFVFRMEF